MATEVRLPQYGMSMHEATIISWLRKVGDVVSVGEPLVEIETDKVTAEVEAPASGTLVHIEAAPGTTVRVAERIGLIE